MARTDDPHPYIHRMRATGMADTLIMQRLILDGWAEKDIAPIFLARGTATPNAPTVTPPVAPVVARAPNWFSRHGAPIMVFTLLFVLAGAGTVTFLFLKPPVVYSISIPEANASSTASTLAYGALPALSDPDYYANVKQKFISQKASFIDADLSSMQLTVYIDGAQSLHVPILAKGKVGSWWETPAGIYAIQTKEPNHLSSIGDVYMPDSMQFQGNFFIHGWPYYPDGTAVSTTYSGGCIRLATDDAKKVYDLVQIGMPVVVYNAPVSIIPFSYQLKAPAVSAQEYLVADADTGTVLFSSNSTVAAPIASISKLVAALVASEYINLDKMISVPDDAIVYTSIARLKAGTSVRAYDLLFLLLQESSNEAAETLASAVGRTQFVQDMNSKANAIGLSHTVFSDPSGAKGDYSTAEDLFTLLRYINDNRQFVFGITSGTITDSAYGTPAFKNIQNFNIIKNSSAKLIGGKVGQTTEADETYAGIFSVSVGGETRNIAIIVLGSKDSEGDVAKFLASVHALYAPGDPATAQTLTAQ